jgi:hypothetical protein
MILGGVGNIGQMARWGSSAAVWGYAIHTRVIVVAAVVRYRPADSSVVAARLVGMTRLVETAGPRSSGR